MVLPYGSKCGRAVGGDRDRLGRGGLGIEAGIKYFLSIVSESYEHLFLLMNTKNKFFPNPD